MDYLNTIHCKKEPFAITPGEDLFLSQPIRDSVEKLTHSIRLGAGLHIVTGAAGTGKTTILQQLSNKFSNDKNTVVLSLHNAEFTNVKQFLTTLAGAFKTIKTPSSMGDKKLQEALNTFIYKQCQQEKESLLLLIDNGHLLPDFCLKALDSIYDHHVDCRRMLQTVICGDTPLQKKIKTNPTINSRVVFTVNLKPFGFKETKELIRFHLEQAAAAPNSPPSLFSGSSQWAIYRLTQGYPKQIIDLCHLVVLTMAIENRTKADWFMTLRCAQLLNPKRAKKLQLARAGSLSSLIVLMLVFGLGSEQMKTVMSPAVRQPARPPVVSKVEAPTPAQPEQVQVEPQPVQKEVPEEATPSEPVIEKEIAPTLPAEEQIAAVSKTGSLVSKKLDRELQPVDSADLIGKITVQPGDTLGRLIRGIYGPLSFKPEYTAKVLAANEHLRNPDSLEVGETIFFPDLPVMPEIGLPAKPAQVSSRGDIPAFLGEIIAIEEETFGDMVRRIYGPYSFNDENVEKVLAVNQDFNDPSNLSVGQKIRFPTILVSLTPKASEVWWVKIVTLDNLQSAYRFLRFYSKWSPPMLIIPSRNDKGQLLFNVLLQKYFMDNLSAQSAIDELPASLAADAKTLQGLDANTFYYWTEQKN